MSDSGRRRRMVLGLGVAGGALAAVVAVFVWSGLGTSSGTVTAARSSPASGAPFAQSPGGPPPSGAASAVQQLVTGTPEQQRAALSAAAAAALPDDGGPLYPAGSKLTLDADGWRQEGDYANATGMLADPSGTRVRVEVGFIAAPDQPGAWKVTFEETLS
ncbi:MAG: hypothetical protein HOW97_05370 [Catenulispora sp.]|nr:hypothetical protein [Catenulispora sp.]